MGLYEQRLAKAEISAIKEILHALYRDKDAKDIIRSAFRGYVKKVTNKPITKFVLSRVVNNPDQVAVEWQMLLYDYVYEILAPSILHDSFPGQYDDGVKKKINNFTELGKRRIPTPWGISGLKEFMQPIHNDFTGKFFGYRLSANVGSIIRFFIDISKKNETVVTYRNLYRRKDVRWEIHGTGHYIDNTLYLVGHATGSEGTVTHGIRMMALRRIGTTDKLCGIVLSSDREFPIAARVILVPIGDHADAQLRDPERSEKMILEDMEDHDLDDVVGDLYSHAVNQIKENQADDPALTFASYIENATPTVLKAGGEFLPNIRELTDKMNKLRAAFRQPVDDGMASRVSGGWVAALSAYLQVHQLVREQAVQEPHQMTNPSRVT